MCLGVIHFPFIFIFSCYLTFWACLLSLPFSGRRKSRSRPALWGYWGFIVQPDTYTILQSSNSLHLSPCSSIVLCMYTFLYWNFHVSVKWNEGRRMKKITARRNVEQLFSSAGLTAPPSCPCELHITEMTHLLCLPDFSFTQSQTTWSRYRDQEHNKIEVRSYHFWHIPKSKSS